MRRVAIIGGAAVLVIGLVGAGLAVASSRRGIVQQQTRRFVLVEGNEDMADVGPAGDSPGDTFFAQGELWNLDLTEEVGHFASACVLENLDSRLNHCTATAFLGRSGKVELSARVRFTESLPGFRLAVVGGISSFQNVVGQATLRFGCDTCPPDVEADTLTLDLVPSFEHP